MEIFKTNKKIEETTIALLSDIHFHPNFNKKVFDQILKQINDNKPNYICITGDILDDSSYTDLKDLEIFLNKISNIATTIVVIGNHDEKTGSMWNWKNLENKKLIQILKNNPNIEYLNDTSYTENNITFYGFNPSYYYYEKTHEKYDVFEKEAKELKGNFPKNTYNITLIHTPINIYNFIKLNPKHFLNKTDLILSGHMHNGLLPNWFSTIINKLFKTNRSIIAPKKGILPKTSQGRVYKIKDGYIHEGITKLAKSTRGFHKFNSIYKPKVKFIQIKNVNK